MDNCYYCSNGDQTFLAKDKTPIIEMHNVEWRPDAPGDWYIWAIDDENVNSVKIHYCPFCGKKLD